MKDFCKKLLDVFKKPLWLLCLGLGIVLFASIFANMANTSFYQVSVTEVSFETEHGEMTGLLYRPKSCTADNPCATIVTTHGYLNSKEMQDAPAVELSKRGYVVLAMDMYAHGDSTWDAVDYSGFTFTKWSQYDAVQWVYEQDYVLKAADGTGIIAVSGHSMGGFSSRIAAYWDTQDVLAGEKQKIVAMLSVGADFSYAVLGSDYAAGKYTTAATIIAADVTAKRTVGTIAGQYDEFFFYEGSESGSVRRKDWTTTNAGAQFYYGNPTASAATVEEFESGQWNETSYGGAGSVIYTPNEIHPWNHFSTESTGYMIEFYDKAFETQIALHNVTENEGVVAYKDGNGQTWWLKEGFNFVGLIGMFIAVVAAIALFAKLPFFSMVTTAEEEINEVSKPTGVRAWLGKALLVATCFATAYVYPLIRMGLSTGESISGSYKPGSSATASGTISLAVSEASPYVQAVKVLMIVAVVVLVAAFVAHFVIKAVKGDDEQSSKVLGHVALGGVAVLAASFFSYWTLTNDFFANTKYYTEEGTTVIAYWVLVSAGLTLISLAISHFAVKYKDGYTCANYGLKANWKQILMALLIAVIVVGGVYGITFLIELLLRVDFRIWTYAIKPFGANHLVPFVRYLPVFFLFYLVNGLSVIANTGDDKTWKGTLKAVLINALPLAILLGVHYGMDFATGTAKWPGLALDMIYVWALVPTMAFAAWIARKSYFKTGNIWTGVFINALLFTLVQVANTILHVYSVVL